MLKYNLKKSSFSTANDKYFASVQDVIVHDQSSLTDLISEHEDILTRGEIDIVLNTLTLVISKLVAKGEGVHTDLFRVYPSITGVFENLNSPFNPTKNEVQVNLSTGSALKTAQEKIKVQKEKPNLNLPEIIEVLDITTGSKNTNIKDFDAVRILGDRIKIAGTDASVGCFFVPEDPTQATEQKVSYFIDNNPSQLTFNIPTLVVGQKYTIKIVTQFGSNTTLLKSPRTGISPFILTVI